MGLGTSQRLIKPSLLLLLFLLGRAGQVYRPRCKDSVHHPCSALMDGGKLLTVGNAGVWKVQLPDQAVPQ